MTTAKKPFLLLCVCHVMLSQHHTHKCVKYHKHFHHEHYLAILCSLCKNFRVCFSFLHGKLWYNIVKLFLKINLKLCLRCPVTGISSVIIIIKNVHKWVYDVHNIHLWTSLKLFDSEHQMFIFCSYVRCLPSFMSASSKCSDSVHHQNVH